MYKITLINNSTRPLEAYAEYFRFVAPKTGNVSSLTLRTNSTNTSKDDAFCAIYDVTDTGYPKNPLGTIKIDVNGGAGLYTSTSWTSTVALTAGTTYYFAIVSDGAAPPTLNCNAETSGNFRYLALGLTHYPGTPYNMIFGDSGTQYSFPSTFDLSEASLARRTNPNWVIEYA